MKIILIGLALLGSLSSYANYYEEALVVKDSKDSLKLHFSNIVCAINKSSEWDNRLANFVFETTEKAHFDGLDMIGVEKTLTFPKSTSIALDREGYCHSL